MKTKLFTLLTLLLCVCSGAWGDEYTASSPATKTYGTGDAQKTFLDVANTKTNATIKDGSVGTLAYCGCYLVSTAKPAWMDNSSSAGTNSSGISTSVALADNGFLPLASSASYTQSKGYSKPRNSKPISFYVTGVTGVAIFAACKGTSQRVALIVQEYDSDGTLGTATENYGSSTNYEIIPSTATFNASKYYKITIKTKTGDSDGEQKLSQIRFTPASCTDVAAPTSLNCSAQTSTSLTFGWTAATNASAYTATLYSDADCTSEVTSTSNITGTSVTFSDLSASATYYCKVQSNGDGETYCAEGGVTDAVSGTTSAKAYTVTAAVNDEDMGSVAAAAGSLDEGETTTVTATANDGYKFVSWAVSGTGASLSSSTDNPTTLTMGTANATVTATFRALETYTISYNAGANGTGTIDAGEKTEDVAFTLSSSTFTRDGYVQTGWSLTDGGELAYELGGSYTTNAAQTFYPFWTAAYTLTYNANSGTGTMEDTEGVGAITLTANAFTKNGYSFIGWATTTDGDVVYADGASYTLSEDATLYAVWAENYYEFTPKTVTEDEALTTGDVVSASTGGVIKVAAMKDASSIKYTTAGLGLTGGGKDSLHVTLNDYMKAGSVITVKLQAGGSGSRGLNLNKPDKTKITTLGWSNAVIGDIKTFSYTVVAGDGLADGKEFQLARNNSVYIQSLTVTNCQPGATISASGWSTYSNNKALDLSTISGGEAYIASAASGSTVTLVPCTDVAAAGIGLMIKGTAGETFRIATTTAEPASISNLLVGLPDGGTVTANNNNYVFGWETASDPGFYFVNSTEPTLGLGKAYLHTTTTLGARLNFFFDDETTGITNNNRETITNNGEYFNLAGQRVAQPAKGLYIVNGKKVVIR
ncbi:MAG: InlB B-repeat-containing protein [Prevotella sp.]|nr:InlB B-repeat-containing protein [Prevotella sp.]